MKTSNIRRGYSLIQLMITMPIVVTLMMIGIGWVHQTLKFTAAIKNQHRNHQNLNRLAWDLRDDIHLSQSMKLVDSNQLTLFAADGAKTNYLISESGLRVEAIENGTVLSRDRYELKDSSKISWDDSEMPDWVTLVVTRGNSTLAKSVDAKPNVRDQRHESIDLRLRARIDRWSGESVKVQSKATDLEQQR